MARGLPSAIPIVPVAVNLVRAATRDRLAPDKMEQLQARLLRKLVTNAHATVPYYRETLDPDLVATFTGPADLHRLPILPREEISLQGPKLLADGFSPANTREARSSGTTGRPATSYFSEGDLGYLRATYLWDLLATGMRPTDRIAYFRVGGFRRHRLEKLGLARNVHVNTSLGLDEQVAAFLTGRPNFLCGFPNAIVAVVGELKRRGIRPDYVRGVVFAGEKVTQAARTEVLEYFGARANEVYASVETYSIARSCPRGALHLRSGDVAVEVEQDDGSVSLATAGGLLEGNILVTRLHAEAMPLLRYRLGDRVLIGPDDCACTTFSTPIVRQVIGRTVDQLQTADGRLRHGDWVGSMIIPLPGIRQFQLVQAEPGKVEVLIVPATTPTDLAERAAAAMSSTPDFDITVRLVDTIHPGPNGKIRMVHSLL